MLRCLAVAVVVSSCLGAAQPAAAQNAAPAAPPATSMPLLGATPRITFGTPGSNLFLDQIRWHPVKHRPSPLQVTPAPPVVKTPRQDGAWKTVPMTTPAGPVTNDCQMPVIVGDTSLDPRIAKPVAPSPNPMAKVATPCPPIRK